jgi:hypothetical protein
MSRISSQLNLPDDAVAVIVFRDSTIYFGYVRCPEGHLPRSAVLEIWNSRFIRKWVTPNKDKDIDVIARSGLGKDSVAYRKVRYQVIDQVRRVVAVETEDALQNLEEFPCND